MTLNDIGTIGGGAVIVLLSLVQIAPVKINPWSAIARAIGRALNADLITKVDKLAQDVAQNQKSDEEHRAVSSRRSILRFNDELLHDVRHTQDHFEQILMDITDYEAYCAAHPDFRNGIAVAATENINKVYKKCLQEHSFL